MRNIVYFILFLIPMISYGQLKEKELKYVVDKDSIFIPLINDYLTDSLNQCSTEFDYYYVINFYDKGKFILTKRYKDVNNAFALLDSYTIVNGKYIFINEYKGSVLYETGFYKNFVYYDYGYTFIGIDPVIGAAWYGEYGKKMRPKIVSKMECNAKY
ncbi:hypothetical protein [Myroides sp. WP-1]|uniref:hypothetical protein n=1 Tax=Myroides sp. WP-1 TaxID=2759944 RepID=UPI0015FB3877|nr:hypothetical protein [Myroides sp. WP-1]MBB1139940.1 hypothetical protein [Myroides sp. WP-1]